MWRAKKAVLKFLAAVIYFSLAVDDLNAQSRVQIIHNAPDPALKTLDVYVQLPSGAPFKIHEDFHFQEHSGFLAVPSGIEVTMGIAPGNSNSMADTILSRKISLTPGTYIFILQGLGDTAGFNTNPEKKNLKFSAFQKSNALTETKGDRFSLFAHNGITDLNNVSVRLRSSTGTEFVADNLLYGDTAAYKDLNRKLYHVELRETTSGRLIRTCLLDLNSPNLKDISAGVLLLSGFDDPAANNNGPPLTLSLAVPSVIGGSNAAASYVLPMDTIASVQFIHNAPDPALEIVDLYLNGVRIRDNFTFSGAMPFLDVPSGSQHIVVAKENSNTAADSIFGIRVDLTGGEQIAAVITGVSDINGFTANPDGKSITGSVYIIRDAQSWSLITGKLSAAVLLQSPDLGKATIEIKGGKTLLTDQPYNSASRYQDHEPGSAVLEIKNSHKIIRSFEFDLSPLVDSAGLVLISGFLDPAANKNGPSLNAILVLPGGLVISANDITAINEPGSTQASFQLFPNPAADRLNFMAALPMAGTISFCLTDLTGRTVMNFNSGLQANAQLQQSVDISGLSTGTYIATIKAGEFIFRQKLIVSRF